MRVKDLIEELEECDENKEVRIYIPKAKETHSSFEVIKDIPAAVFLAVDVDS